MGVATDVRMGNFSAHAFGWMPGMRLFKDKSWDITFVGFKRKGRA